MTTQVNTCGSKHMKLASCIVGVVLAVCAATVAFTMSEASAQDDRIRQLEQSNAAVLARLDNIQHVVGRIERKLDHE